MGNVDAKTLYDEAKRLHALGRDTEALECLERFPDSKNILLARAECHVALGNHDVARDMCQRVLAQQEDGRARRILDHLPPPLSAVVSAQTHADAPAQTAVPVYADLPPTPEAAGRSGKIVPLTAIALVILIGGAYAFIASRPDPNSLNQQKTANERAFEQLKQELPEPVDPVGNHARMLEERKAKRDAAKKEAEAKETAAVEASREKPGYVVPPEEWNLDPVTGVPAWRPGIYHQLPCPGSWFEDWQGPRTLDLYIPLAYAERPDELFPTLSITLPHVNPGFLGLESWAEQRDVIIIVINTSTNDHHPNGNTEAQIAAMNFLYGHLRTHPTLNFVTGFSGGARMALRAAARWPEAFAGVLMMAHSGDDLVLNPNLRVGIIHGRDDFNAPYIPGGAAQLRAKVLEVRVQVIPGGHIVAPPSEAIKMLDWMLTAARRDLEQTSATPVE